MVSIDQSLNMASLDTASTNELRRILKALVVDIAAVKADLVIVAAQLDDDEGVTDTDYEAALVSSPTVTE